jgi:hypothetical protein
MPGQISYQRIILMITGLRLQRKPVVVELEGRHWVLALGVVAILHMNCPSPHGLVGSW